MKGAELARLDKQVERDLERPEISRASSILAADTERHREEADRAADEERRRALIERAGGWLLGRIGDQRGRTLDLIQAGNHVYVKGQSTLSPGVVTILSVEQAHGLADALERGHGRVSTAAGRWLEVERIVVGFLIKDPGLQGSWSVLVQLSQIEATRMASDLRRAG